MIYRILREYESGGRSQFPKITQQKCIGSMIQWYHTYLHINWTVRLTDPLNVKLCDHDYLVSYDHQNFHDYLIPYDELNP